MAVGAKTEVEFEKSVAEVITLLRRAGADQIGQMDGSKQFALQFELGDRAIRFRIPFLTDAEVTERTGPRQSMDTVREQWRRQRGRALLLVVRAKLESVESGLETVEEAFLANVVVGNQTVYERVREPISIEYQGGTAQPLLGGPR